MDYRNKITVITVCYNAADTLEQTIESVINQTYQNIEYIIVDGGSTDETLSIIRKYEHKITKWISEPDKGIYDAMNKGIEMASGEWLNFMNAGDVFASKDVLEKIFSSDYPDKTAFLYSDNYYKGKEGRLLLSHHDHKIPSILHQSAIYRKELHNRHGLYAVTPKIIISDFLFFCMIPAEKFKKVDTIISINTTDGISGSSLWCGTQRLCAMVVFRKYTFKQMLIHYAAFRLKMAFPKIYYSFLKKKS